MHRPHFGGRTLLHGAPSILSTCRRRRSSLRFFPRSLLCSKPCGGASPSWPIRRLSDSTVGPSNSVATETSLLISALIRVTTWMASSEWPPRSKKLSWMPTFSTPSRSAQIRATFCWTGVPAATNAF